jgi:FMN phosphatase YigB (HAD superfamily)
MKAIIWDLDDTIYKSPPQFGDKCYDIAANLALLHGFIGTIEDAKQEARRSFVAYGYSIASFFLDHAIDQETIEQEFNKSISNLISSCDNTHHYIANFTGPQMVISHSRRAWVDAMMHKLNLDPLIGHTHRIASDDIGHNGKAQSSAPYKTASTLLGYSPSDIAIFEDSAINLIHAKALGMTTILITNGKIVSDMERQNLTHVDHIISRPYDIKTILA